MSGSVTSIGVAYPRTCSSPELAERLLPLFGSFLKPPSPGRWPMNFVTTRDWEVRIETSLKQEAEASHNLGLLERFLSSSYGELQLTVELPGLGSIDGVIRPETAVCGVLLDLPDAQLFIKWSPARARAVETAIRKILKRWYVQSPFNVAFADHEAEFDIDPLELRENHNPYALLALPGGQEREEDLEFFKGGWLLSPLGS